VPCPRDHVNRQFNATHPNVLWISDFTHVSTWAGFVHVAVVIARRIVGWRALALTSALIRGRRVGDAEMGGLVQPSSAAGAHRKYPAGRGRGAIIRKLSAMFGLSHEDCLP